MSFFTLFNGYGRGEKEANGHKPKYDTHFFVINMLGVKSYGLSFINMLDLCVKSFVQEVKSRLSACQADALPM